MPLPQPPVPLEDQCTIIYNNTLYAYQANAFQSLDLKEGGTWSKLSTGVSTNGSTCVQGSVDGKASLIVVGGSGPSDYKGLQHYDLTSKQWNSITPADAVAMNRVRHGSALLQQTNEILVYGGSQDGNPNPSTETFLISINSPYAVRAFASNAPPVTNPLLLQYNTTHALLLGGDPTNKALNTFGPDEGWQHMNGTSLPSGLKDSSQVQAVLMTAGDGGKLLEIFDFSATPNQVSTVLLSNTSSSSTSTNRRRSFVAPLHQRVKRQSSDSSLSNRPAYNNTLAPQDSRNGFSLAQDSQNGLVVAAGGNQQTPVAIFNQTGNQWVDPNKFFGDEPIPSATPSSSTSPAASSTYSMPPASSSAVAAANNQVRNKSLTILGAVLGGVFGVALLVVIILFLLRYYRKRRARKELQRRSEYALEHKNEPMDFTDIGADFMKEAGGSTTMLPSTHQYQNHQRNKSAHSDRSVDPRTLDRGMTASSESRRALLHMKDHSAGSGKSFWSRGNRSPDNGRSPPQISAPILGPPLAKNIGAAQPTFLSPNDPRTEPRNDTGWSRYFTNDNTGEVLPPEGIKVPDQTQQYADNRPQTYLSDSQAQSDYTSSRVASSHPHESAEVEPLSFYTSQAPPNISNRGITSPDASRADGLGLALTHGPSPEQERDIEPATPTTLNGSVSNMTEEDDDFHHQVSHISHGESSGHDSWDPIGTSSSDQRESTWTDDRPFSAAVRSTNSKIYPHPGQRVQIPDFPMPNSARNSTAPSPMVRSPNTEIHNPFDQRGLRNVISKDLARTGSGRQRPVEAPRTGTQRVLPGQGQGESTHAFPRPREQTGTRARGGSQTEDMSWLNLGTSAEQGNHNDLYFPGR